MRRVGSLFDFELRRHSSCVYCKIIYKIRNQFYTCLRVIF
jgi:hypothetical protein